MQPQPSSQPVLLVPAVEQVASLAEKQWQDFTHVNRAEVQRVARAKPNAEREFPNFSRLPVDLQQRILLFMDYQTRYNFTQTCKG